jgi:acid phosphatase
MRFNRLSALLLAALCAGCSITTVKEVPPAAAMMTPAHDNFHSTLWMQRSVEYQANVRGSFAQARRQLELALVSPTWDALPPAERALIGDAESLPPAVIVDVDETMLDNSPFQARGVRDDQPYDFERWKGWSDERRALALPGAREFAQAAADRGVTVYYVTNRKYPHELDSTAENLLMLGFPLADDRSNMLLKGDPRAAADDKIARRAWVGARHRVLLLIGDQLGDFVADTKVTAGQQEARAAPYVAWWGERWFMLPNPTYGGWQDGVLKECDAALRDKDPRACLRSGLRLN